MALTDAIRDWHDVFMLFGEASATMVGLLFVAASVGSGVFTKDKQDALRALLSPSVVHFSCILAACLIAVSPLKGRILLGGLITSDGLLTSYDTPWLARHDRS